MNRLLALISAILCVAWAVAAATRSPGGARPPTPDPTYGLRPPRSGNGRVKPVPGSAAQWIWAARTGDEQSVGLRRVFELDRRPDSAEILVTADNYFTLWVNGHRVDGTAPQAGSDRGWEQVHRYPVDSLLIAGRNVIALEGRNATGPAGAVAALLLRPGRRSQEIVTDAQWRVKESPPAGWERPDTDDSSWEAATVLAPLGGGQWAGALRDWPGMEADPPYLAHLDVPPTAATVLSAGRGRVDGADRLAHSGTLTVALAGSVVPEAEAPAILVDFGREITGRVRIESASERPIRLALSLGESEEEALKGPYTGIQHLEVPARGQIAAINSAYRYAKISFLAGPSPIRIRRVVCEHIYYPVEYRGSFDCSDPMLTRLWYVGAYTAHLCMQNDIWDAPKRDRLRWMGDLHVSGEVINNVFLDRFLMQQTMDRLRADAGNPVRGHVNGIPGYSCAWVGGQADLYRHTGDLEYLRKQHDSLVSLLEFFRGEMDERGLFANRRGQWPYVDWSPNFNGVDPHALKATHLFLVRELNEGAWLLEEMGDREAAAKYRSWARDAAQAAQRFLTATGNDTFGDRWQENTWAVYSGVATPAQGKAIWSKVLSHRYPADLFITPYQHNYTLQAMSALGHTREALDLARWYWGGMLAEGATSTWEGYDPRWPKAHFHRELQADNGKGYFVSLAHGWSAGVTTWLTQAILGVRPIEPGMRRVSIRPELEDLTWVAGKVPTPRGAIEVSVGREGQYFHAEVVLPPNTNAEFALPGQAMRDLGPGKHSLRGLHGP